MQVTQCRLSIASQRNLETVDANDRLLIELFWVSSCFSIPPSPSCPIPELLKADVYPYHGGSSSRL